MLREDEPSCRCGTSGLLRPCPHQDLRPCLSVKTGETGGSCSTLYDPSHLQHTPNRLSEKADITLRITAALDVQSTALRCQSRLGQRLGQGGMRMNRCVELVQRRL